MLELLGKLSVKLQPLRKLSFILGIFFLSVIITQLLQTPSQQQQFDTSYAVLSFIACMWLLLFNILISIFANIPCATNKSLSVLASLKIKLQRIFYQFLALLFIVLTLVILLLTIRLVRSG